ncbi:recombinase family protein [Desulfovibrio piger]|uniref:recombinase family protein n=1 Tax=Desulfovibrio piger TaxID=901 RepID=UPI0026F308F6|nr:recombinase family protein [Desulfovibrio piger]
MKNTYGYIRVSSIDQNEKRQVIALEEQGISMKNIYVDKMSGKNFDRPQYWKLIKKLHKGDTLCVTSIDRLGRNYEEIQDQWRMLTKEKKINIFVLDMPLLDTRQETDLMGKFIADLVLQILSFVAQNERENIRKRQAEGIAAAKRNGVRFGPKPHPLPGNFPDVFSLWKQGNISMTEAAKRTHMARSTFRKKSKCYESDLSMGAKVYNCATSCCSHTSFPDT